MACDQQMVEETPSRSLRIGTWNMSHWTVDKAMVISRDIPVDVLAVQETHLAPLPLEWARTTSASLGINLYHGRPAVPIGNSPHGKSCGVGVVSLGGVSLSPVLPQGAPWRMLHARRRLATVQLPPRPGLPRGLLLVSLYAPLSTQPVDREQFVLAMLEFTHTLDMQVPTLLLGDFNGVLCPARDTASGSHDNRPPICPLLASLLGPGGAWVDVHANLLAAPLPWTFEHPGSQGRLAASRIDLILANRAAMLLVQSATVLPTVRSGGHCPVLVSLHLVGPIGICWQRPRPRPPALLLLPSADLCSSLEWADIVQQWSMSSQALSAMSPSLDHTLESLSRALLAALQHLVDLAGGWQIRPPVRRPAYDSAETRRLRGQLTALRHLQALVQRSIASPSPGSWPRSWQVLLEKLCYIGVDLPRSSVPALLSSLTLECQRCQQQLNAKLRAMRQERHHRWKATLPQLWKERPRVIHHWLHASGAPWGSTPILDADGHQCLNLADVDNAVRSYWVDSVLRHHAAVDEDSSWTTFCSSRFGPHIPIVAWPSLPWTGERVRDVLSHMRERSSPGSLGIPIAVWRSLPQAWMCAVARLLSLVEAAGCWPADWMDAYVTMIPKAAGGSRPRDQRPITVLEVLYRIWAKGVALAWAPTLQHVFLGPSAMGFRAQCGTVHLVQLLSDIIVQQRRRKSPLWLASFDIEKCYDMLPWWALFRTLLHAGVPPGLVGVFRSFYGGLRRRFRYGQLDGDVWHATNGLAQGCPASPDLLNILFEAFHRWAHAAGLGIEIAGIRVASVSFADDLALVAASKKEMVSLIDAYLEWCQLLGVNVVKVQLWCNQPGVHSLRVADRSLQTSSTFRMVGVVLASCESTATRQHLAPRLEKALATAHRLRCLPLPVPITALLWRSAVLAQALYGCEVRDIRPALLAPLMAAGRALFTRRPPLYLNLWRSPIVLFSPSLGDFSVCDPMLEVRQRQMRWLQLLANSPGLVGNVHRAMAWVDDCWADPTPALQGALKDLGWYIRRNLDCRRAVNWPQIAPEVGYPGTVLLEPVDQFPSPGAAFTDGSFSTIGGAAAVMEHSESVRLATIPTPRSSTHCELVALCLALSLSPVPSQILTDSLASLHLALGWGRWSVARTLRCADRVEIRQLVYMASQLPVVPVLEKVKAHDKAAIDAGHPKAIGNDLADQQARRAAKEPGHPVWKSAAGHFGDPVEILDVSGMVVMDVVSAVHRARWSHSHRQLVRGRPWFMELYPVDEPIDWQLSSGIFRRPTVNEGCFVYPVPLLTLKWIGRLRAGCLATGHRRHRHLGPPRVPSPCCLCCGAAQEDDRHAVVGCSATGSADWLANFTEAWQEASKACCVEVPLPGVDWLESLCFPLLAALIPASLVVRLPLSPSNAVCFLSRLHRSLAQITAERLRRRQDLITSIAMPPSPSSALPIVPRTCPLPPERQLSVADLRQLEVQRRVSQLTPLSQPLGPAVPPSGEPRRIWLQSRLARLLNEDTVVCDLNVGAVATCLLELFERITAEKFTMTPGALLTARVRALARVMATLMRRAELLDAPLLSGQRVCRTGSYSCWNRRPRVWADWEAWRRQVILAETFQRAPQRASQVRGQVDAELAGWLRQHRYLQPVDVSKGEPSMALMLLWEVEHGRSFPTEGTDTASGLAGFTRRLLRRVALDEDLTLWLTTKEVQQPLAPGLPDSHHTRWSVRICPPASGEPQGWYTEFTRRWRSYLGSLAHPMGRSTIATTPSTVASSSISPIVLGSAPSSRSGRRRPRSVEAGSQPRARRRTAPPLRPSLVEEIELVEEATSSSNVAQQETPSSSSTGRVRRRSTATESHQRSRKRQCSLHSWLKAKPTPKEPQEEMPVQALSPPSPTRHGRASLGPPT